MLAVRYLALILAPVVLALPSPRATDFEAVDVFDELLLSEPGWAHLFHVSVCSKPAITVFLELQFVASPHKLISAFSTAFSKSSALACWRFCSGGIVAAYLAAGSSSTAALAFAFPLPPFGGTVVAFLAAGSSFHSVSLPLCLSLRHV